MNTNTLKPVMFFTDDITLIPHSLSSELADKLKKPLTIREFAESTGAQRVSLYTTEDFEQNAAAFYDSILRMSR